MSTIAVLGGGAGGVATAVDLGLRGFSVRYWSRRASRLTDGELVATGVLDGRVRPEVITDDVTVALEGVQAAVVSLPATAYPTVMAALADAAHAGTELPTLILNPGHTGGALGVAAWLRDAHVTVPPIVELSTLAYVARSPALGTVNITGLARRVRGAACFDRGDGQALDIAQRLFPSLTPEPDVLATSLSNVNLVLHPPGALLSAAWVEATEGQFTFYGEAMTPGVARVISALDRERRAVAAAFGHQLPFLEREMVAIGTADAARAAVADLRGAITGGAANAMIMAPDNLEHRYYREDFAYGLVPFLALADVAEVDVPLARSLVITAAALLGVDRATWGLTAGKMGITGYGVAALQGLVRGELAHHERSI
jgi:opine dehydrogenase